MPILRAPLLTAISDPTTRIPVSPTQFRLTVAHLCEQHAEPHAGIDGRFTRRLLLLASCG
jgi:hypothetical protein